MDEPIAIIGMSGRYPQDSTDNDRFWQNLLRGRSMMTPFPKEKIEMDGHWHPDPEHGGSFANKGGHFLEESPAEFDAPFFSATKNEVMAMDPQQRILMENVYSAIENAGIPMNKLASSMTSVYIGAFMGDFLSLLDMDPEQILKYKPVGTSNSILSGRVSWFYDLKGPSLTLDTACSSSMVAFHLACQSLRNKEADMSIVSGVSVVNYPTNMYAMSNIGFLSPDGLSYSFDHRANGYSRGEGVGTIIIKPLSKALRDGDTIRAVVRATGVNQDGRTPGITLPSRIAQEQLIRDTYANAGLDVADTSYVEAHGTGTSAGDPIEAGAIAAAFNSSRKETPLYIGAVKSAIGHLEGASGVAGLMKTVLVLESGVIPPNVNFERVNPKIPMDKWNLRFPTEPTPFPVNGLRRASISSFGFGGTNAHVILDDSCNFLQSKFLNGIHRTVAVPPTRRDIQQYIADHQIRDTMDEKSEQNGHATNGNGINGHSINGNGVNGHSVDGEKTNGTNGVHHSRHPPRLFVWSSFDEQGIERISKTFSEFLFSRASPKGKREEEYLDDLAYTLASKRTSFPWKSYCLASSVDELAQTLSKASGIPKPVRRVTAPQLGFVFTGQGAQWYAMGRELFVYPIFTKRIEEADTYFKSLGSSWSLMDELRKDKENSLIDRPSLSQPSCTALQVALVDLLASWDVRPARVIGHSSGEIGAAYCAGALDRESAWKVAYYRGIVSEKEQVGAMMAVGIAELELQPYLSVVNREIDGVMTIACFNSPKSLTISGDERKIDKLKELLDADQIFAKKLKVRNAYHSAHMQSVADEYLRLMEDLQAPTTLRNKSREGAQMFSSVTGKLATNDELANAEYWVGNMVSPVRFEEALLAMCSTASSPKRLRLDKDQKSLPVNEIIELGPHTALQGAIKDTLATDSSFESIGYHGVLNRNSPEVATILRTMGVLHSRCLPVNVESVNKRPEETPREPRMLTNLPSYKFNHARTYWPESRFSKNFRSRKFPRHDLFGAPVSDWDPNEPRWRQVIRVSELPWLNDHKVTGSIVYPGVGYLIMAIEAAKQIANPNATITGFRLKDISIKAALVIPESVDGVETILSMHRMTESSMTPSSVWNEFRVVSYDANGNNWIEHCSGTIGVEYKTDTGPIDNGREAQAEAKAFKEKLSSATELCKHPMDIEGTYDEMATIGLSFGPLFKNLSQVTLGHGTGEAMGTVTVPNIQAAMPKNYMHSHLIHPATMDSMLHLFLAAIMDSNGGVMLKEPMLPVFIQEVWASAEMNSNTGHSFRCHGKATQISHNKYQANITVWDGLQDEARITIKGLQSIPLQSAAVAASSERKLAYYVDWKPDIDLLDSTEYFLKTADLKDNSAYLEQVKNLQLASMLLIKNALKDFHGKPAQPHLEKYLEWMQHHSDNLTNGKVIHQVPEWEPYFDNKELGDSFIEKVGSSTADGQLTVRMGKEIAPILRGDVDALHLLFNGELLDQFYTHNFSSGNIVSLLTSYLETFGHNYVDLKILEIGAGTGGTTLPILETLNRQGQPLKISEYTFTDISAGFFEKARSKFKNWLNVMKFKTLDIEKDPLGQGFELGTYDIIVAGNVLHATADLSVTLANTRALLRPGGKLILDEGIQRDFLWVPVIFGLVPGWWLSTEPNRRWGPLMSEPEWDVSLRNAGFSGNDLLLKDNEDFGTHGHSMIISSAANPSAVERQFPKTFIVISENTPGEYPAALQQKLSKSNNVSECTVVDYQDLNEFDLSDIVCIVLLGLEEPFLAEMNAVAYANIQKLLTDCERMIWVTDDTTSNPGLAMATGLIRTVRWERDFINLNLNILSLESPRPEPESVIDTIERIFTHQFVDTTKNKNAEYLFADGTIFTNRLVDEKPVNEYLESKSSDLKAEVQPFGQPERALKLSTSSPGLLNALEFVEDETWSEPLTADWVEVEVKASGLNFRDIMVAMGEVPNTSFGDEGAGIVTKVGPDVDDLKVGDRVLIVSVALGTFQTYTRATRPYVKKIPDSMPFEVAAGIPVIFCTALYCLGEIGRLAKGETILIHAAAGGMGQASIMLAQSIGAEIFATVSTNEKKALLMDKYGIPEDHIFSSRDLSFAKGVMRETKGRGVDVILNSLAGEALRRSWDCIAHFGRFIEIGKRDIFANGRLEMFPFSRSVLYAGVDFATVVKLDPAKTSKLLQESLDLFSQGKIHSPQPYNIFDYSQMESAFRLLQGGKGMGKIVLKSSPSDMVPVVPKALVPYKFEDNATYVLAGGLGGIGRSIARWMVSLGAKHLVFLSRSGAKSDAAKELIEDLRAKGCGVGVYECDVSDKSRLASVIGEVSTIMPPIKGCVQGSMQLKDAMFENMSFADYQAAVRPKVQGSWNLHSILPESMDFFVLLSSICSVLGIRGQANYAAGNTYQDALAQYRKSQGLAATSLDLGNILSVGYVAERREQKSFTTLFSFVLDAIREDELHSLIEYNIDTRAAGPTRSPRAQLVTGLTTSETYRQKGAPEPSYMNNPLFTQLRARSSAGSSGENEDSGPSTQALLRTANSLDVAGALISDAIQKKLSYIMIIPVEEVDPQRSISSYGVDSLVAMELRSWFGKEMAADVQILDLMGTSSIAELSGKIAGMSKIVNLSDGKKAAE